MYGRRKREPFNEKRLIDGHACNAAQDKATDMPALNALFFPGKKPKAPEQHQAKYQAQHIDGQWCNKRWGNKLYETEIGCKEQVGCNYCSVGFYCRRNLLQLENLFTFYGIKKENMTKGEWNSTFVAN